MKLSTGDRKGVVLLIVLGVLALMSVIAISFVKMSNLEKVISRNYVDRTRALLAAESGVEYALSRIENFSGGAMRADEVADMYYVPGDEPGLQNAVRASFQTPGSTQARSGTVADSYAVGSDYFILHLNDESAKINLNDTDGLWNIDDDPVYDDPFSDPDLLDAPHRLAEMVAELGRALFDGPGSPPIVGTQISVALFTARQTLPGGRFSSMAQVRQVLVDDASLEEEQADEFLEHVALDTWQDTNVLRPTFQLNISTASWAPIPDQPFNPDASSEYFNIYLYSDFQTQYFESEARSPVNVNTASKEVLEAIIAPLQGWYLYEGAPCGMMDSSYLGPWVRSFRAAGHFWKDWERGKGLACACDYSWNGVDANHPSADSRLWNQTRHGEARLTRSFRDAADGVDLDGDGADDSIAAVIATLLRDRAQGKDLNLDGDFEDGGEAMPDPFLTWDQFTRFIYQLVDPVAEIVPGEFNSAVEEGNRTPYRIGDGTEGTVYPGFDCDSTISGFDRYMADALLANVNPNALLNDHNPDMSLFRHVDKAQLTSYTTELCFEPTGQFQIHSMGVVSGAAGEILATSEVRTRLNALYKIRISTQDQFMKSYDPGDHDSLYTLFAETGTANYPTAGCDMAHGTGNLVGGGKWGPSVTSYPEPVRNVGSLSIGSHPDADQKNVWFSRFDGRLALSTQQRPENALPTGSASFMAPMSWRHPGSLNNGQWLRKSAGVGDMIPVLFGKNDENNFDTGATIVSDNVDGVGTGVGEYGKGAMRMWAKLNDHISLDMSQYIHDPVLQAPALPLATYPSQGWYTPPLLTPDAGYPYPFSVPTTVGIGSEPYWHMTIYDFPFGSPWFDPSTGRRYESWEETMHHYSDHAFTVPFIANVKLDGHADLPAPAESGWDHVERDVPRMGWNYPTDCPVTPSHRDPGTGARVDRVQGVLYPDGALSDPGRSLSYKATNFGSNFGMEGAMMFWAKPNFEPGYSNRIRVLMGMGHTGENYLDAFNLIYFPASPHVSKSDFPSGGQGETQTRNFVDWNGGKWPLARNSFLAGATNLHWSEYPGPEGWLRKWVGSKTATDFMPYRNIAQRGSHESWGFYAHQWSLFGLSYDMGPGGGGTDLFVNGILIDRSDVSYRPTPPYYSPGVPMPGEFDPFWEEAHFHSFERLNGAGGLRGEPEDLHQGEGYARFGWMNEAGGPSADCTYDDIVGWQTEVGEVEFQDVWNDGRYINRPLDDPFGMNTSAVGLYTSPEIDVFNLLKGELGGINSSTKLQVHSVAWTLYWPRYNWRPEGASSNPDWRNWPSGTYYGMDGVDLHGPGAREQDPVYGDLDPITVDFWSEGRGEWVYSGDTGFGARFNAMNEMPSVAAGSRIDSAHRFSMTLGDKLMYRIYFHADGGTPLLESPVFDDITITLSTGKMTVLSWEVVN